MQWQGVVAAVVATIRGLFCFPKRREQSEKERWRFVAARPHRMRRLVANWSTRRWLVWVTDNTESGCCASARVREEMRRVERRRLTNGASVLFMRRSNTRPYAVNLTAISAFASRRALSCSPLRWITGRLTLSWWMILSDNDPPRGAHAPPPPLPPPMSVYRFQSFDWCVCVWVCECVCDPAEPRVAKATDAATATACIVQAAARNLVLLCARIGQSMNVLRLARLFPATQFASGDTALLEMDGCSLTHNVELRLCATRCHALERVARAIGDQACWLCTTRLPLPLSHKGRRTSQIAQGRS